MVYSSVFFHFFLIYLYQYRLKNGGLYNPILFITALGTLSGVFCVILASSHQHGVLLMLLEYSHIFWHCKALVLYIHCPSPRICYFPTDTGCFYWRMDSKAKALVHCSVILSMSPQPMKHRNPCMHNSPCALTSP